MRHTLPIAPQFYVTAPQPCPYLDGRMERKLFTALQGDQAERLNDALSKQGFRRSQNVLYRPSCTECSACLSARIRVADFEPNRTQRRTLRRNSTLRRNASSPWATEDQYALFRRYLDSRHADGGMADMDVFEFAAMVEETPIRTRVVEYSRPPETGERGNPLVAVCLTDILDHVAIAREAGLPYLYLGYWVPGSRKMGYKAQFPALDIYKGGRWQPIGDPDSHEAALHPLSVDPIAEQVARIQLPDGLVQR